MICLEIHVLFVATALSFTAGYNRFQCNSCKKSKAKANETTNNVHSGNIIHFHYRNHSLRIWRACLESNKRAVEMDLNKISKEIILARQILLEADQNIYANKHELL